VAMRAYGDAALRSRKELRDQEVGRGDNIVIPAGGGTVSGVLADEGAGMSPLYGTVDVTDDGQVGGAAKS
jgi:hypothetical protein